MDSMSIGQQVAGDPAASMGTPAVSDQVEIVWNKGIAQLCDWRIPDEFPGGRYTAFLIEAGTRYSAHAPHNLVENPEIFSGIQEGDLVWVRLGWLNSFVQQVLPQITANFILVTAGSDSSVPSEVEIADAIVGHPRLLHWYTQNYDGSAHPRRISPLPIGIDFHCLSERPIWGEEQSPCTEQEQTLISIRRGLPPLPDRIPKIYCDFAWQSRNDDSLADRKTLLKHFRPDVIFNQPAVLPRSEMWRRRGEYAFVLSAPGYGLDCHRTWEALALGHIVVVPSTPLDPLYAGLPVVIVSDWRDVTRERLAQWLSQYGDWEPSTCPQLTSQYWVEQMRSLTAKSFDPPSVFLQAGMSAPIPRLRPSLSGMMRRFAKLLRAMASRLRG